MNTRGSIVHWLSAVAAAIVLLVAIPMITTGATSGYRVSNSRKGVAVFNATNIKPGQVGSGRLLVKNSGTKPVTFRLTQDRVVNTGFGADLRLQVHDDTRNWCYYPVRRRGACSTWGLWRGGTKLTRVPLYSRRGAARWPARESHAFTVRWTLAAASPNTDQGRSATFRLVWRSTS